MEEQRELRWTELNPACLLRRVLRELPVILAAGLTALLLTVTVLQATYHHPNSSETVQLKRFVKKHFLSWKNVANIQTS